MTDAFLRMVLSSHVLYAGGPSGPSGKLRQVRPPPPAVCVASPPMKLLSTSIINALLPMMSPRIRCTLEPAGWLKHGKLRQTAECQDPVITNGQISAHCEVRAAEHGKQRGTGIDAHAADHRDRPGVELAEPGNRESCVRAGRN